MTLLLPAPRSVDGMQSWASQLSLAEHNIGCPLLAPGYWKSRHADAVKRNQQLQQELDESKAEIKNLKAERFGKRSEKGSAVDCSNDLDDPQDPASPKKKRGQQPGRMGGTDESCTDES